MSFFDPQKKKRKLVALVPTSPFSDPKRIQSFFDEQSIEWFESDSLLWNYTINPDGKIICCSQGIPYKRASPGQCRTFIHAQIVHILTRFKCKELLHLRGFVIYYEFGDRNGRFHANLTTCWDPLVSTSMKWYIKTELQKKFGKSSFSIDLKDHREKMERPDSYNPKDCGVMSSYGYKPHAYTVTPYIAPK